MADVKALAEGLVALTVKEVQELAEFLKSEYGIEPAAAAVVVSGGGDGGGAAPGGPVPTIIVTVNPIDEALQEGDPFKLPEIPETPITD
jgi:ribosomal protein L7/L12